MTIAFKVASESIEEMTRAGGKEWAEWMARRILEHHQRRAAEGNAVNIPLALAYATAFPREGECH